MCYQLRFSGWKSNRAVRLASLLLVLLEFLFLEELIKMDHATALVLRRSTSSLSDEAILLFPSILQAHRAVAADEAGDMKEAQRCYEVSHSEYHLSVHYCLPKGPSFLLLAPRPPAVFGGMLGGVG